MLEYRGGEVLDTVALALTDLVEKTDTSALFIVDVVAFKVSTSFQGF